MISIRKATLKDMPSLVKLWVEFMNDHDRIILKENKSLKPHIVRLKNAPNKYRKFVTEKIKSRKGAVLIGEVDKEIAGYALIFIKDNIPVFELGKLGYFSDLYVKKQFRNLGVSSGLKDEAIKWFKKKGMKYMSIATYLDNKFARSIYQNWGFRDYHIELRRKI